MENDRYAERLRDPEEYDRTWGKKSTPSLRDREESTIPQTKTLSSETFSEREFMKTNQYLFANC